MYIVAALIVGFVAGVLFRDAYSMFRKAVKEYNESMVDHPQRKRRHVTVWVIVFFFSLFQIALGGGVVAATMRGAETQDCLVNLAESSTHTRDSAIVWVENMADLVRTPERDPQISRNDFIDSSEVYVSELEDDTRRVEECLEKSKDGLW